MDIELGARVVTADGAEVGQVHRVVVDLEQQAVTALVVLRGRLLPRDVLVPLAAEDPIERTRGFASAVADLLQRDDPDRIVTVQTKRIRGRVHPSFG